jgi:signal peptidase
LLIATQIGGEVDSMKKILNILLSILCVCFAVVLVINVTLIAQSLLDEDKIPDVLGYFPLVVLSDSMYPTFESGDLVVYHKDSSQDVTVGDVIVFYDPASSSGKTLVTHRVIEVMDEDGTTEYRTKGDANNSEDKNLVPTENIVGLYRTRISGAGNIALFLQSTKGMRICVVMPLCLFVVIDSFGKRTPKEAQKEA